MTTSNMDAALSSLAAEINELDKQGKSVQAAMGHKLIAVRALLRERNGCAKGKRDVTGNFAPKGWTKWVELNLTIGASHASDCVRFAIDPEVKARHQANRTENRVSNYPTTAIRFIRKCWPNIPTEDRSKIRQLVIELSKEAY